MAETYQNKNNEEMATEIDEYLREEFINRVSEEEKKSTKIPLYSQFDEIKKSLTEKKFLPYAPKDASLYMDWTSIRGNLYYLHDLLTECQMLPKTHLVTMNSLRMKLNKIKGDLVLQLQRLPSITSGEAWKGEDRQLSTRYVDPSKVHGFDDELISLKKLLLEQGSDGHFKAIGITGMAGVGKTALCQVIFNKQEVKEYFLPKIWVCMSGLHPDEDAGPGVAITKRTLSCLGVEEEAFEGYGLKELLYALHLQLVGKRYLIVFDDARDIDGHESWYNRQLNLPLSHAYDETWDSLASGLPKGYGGAVIVTSRDEKLVGKMVGKENIRHILPLSESDESCWSIFKEAAGENPNEEDDMKKEILLKCTGIPLVAKMMGQIKKSQTLSNSEMQAASNEKKQA